jgi:hypothetical protein
MSMILILSRKNPRVAIKRVMLQAMSLKDSIKTMKKPINIWRKTTK